LKLLLLKFQATRLNAVVNRLARPPPVVRTDLVSLNVPEVFKKLAVLCPKRPFGNFLPLLSYRDTRF
jgi:hypothetical protein